MQQQQRIEEIGDDLASDAGAIAIIIGEELEGRIKATAMFTRLNEGDSELREPLTDTAESLGQRITLAQFAQRSLDFDPIRSCRRMLLELFERAHDRQPRSGQLS